MANLRWSKFWLASLLVCSIALLGFVVWPALAETVQVEPESGEAVASVVVEATNETTGQVTDQTLPVVSAPTVPSEIDNVEPGSQIVNLQVAPEQCLVDLEIKKSDGSVTDMAGVDVCGLDKIVVEEPAVQNLNPEFLPPP